MQGCLLQGFRTATDPLLSKLAQACSLSNFRGSLCDWADGEDRSSKLGSKVSVFKEKEDQINFERIELLFSWLNIISSLLHPQYSDFFQFFSCLEHLSQNR